ncbi:MAG: hypothetical protein JXN61_16365 [Sedimentisphaerales bacterium]|nr:hypothetical protein [Sedimentisphaerales bacterium]
MKANHAGSGKSHSVTGVILLIILGIIGAVILVRQGRFDIGRFGIEAGELHSDAAEDTVGAGAEVSGTAGGGVTLSSLTGEGVVVLGDVETYSTDTLYEKIDGKSPLYTESGFEQLRTQRFAVGGKDELGAEMYLYDMGNARNAFSVYSRQKRPDAELVGDVRFGYKTSNALYFAHGRYYVECVGYAESEELIEAMREMARNLASCAPLSSEDEMDELTLFPEDNLITGSYKLYLTNTFGYSGLSNTFAARYEIDGQPVTVFFSSCDSPADAGAMADSYRQFLLENGAKVKDASSEEIKSVEAVVLDFYGATEIVTSAGRFVAGVHEADEQAAAEKAALIIIAKLKEVADE